MQAQWIPSCLPVGLKSAHVTASVCPLKCLARVGSSCNVHTVVKPDLTVEMRNSGLLYNSNRFYS